MYVIRSDGAMRVLQGPAASSVIPEINVSGPGRAVHVFDASANANLEPAQSNAFLIQTSCRNANNYAHPSMCHTLGELAHYSVYFGVGC